MNSIDPKCNELKWQYDECFQQWLSGEYLNNNKKFPENFVPCEKFAAPYQACVQAHLDNEGIKLSDTIESVKKVCEEDLKTAKAKINEDTTA